ncbi:hypothetical protein CS022_09980 [Veronia nyctiphanis]|uniref:Metallopeptidase DUF4344 n=1 Tax=Veronia nyctiphanis TaxID=1278244 RepID=A0A4Q0YQJ6_9GAMM|nr:DUF4344 domain-containing metallopeptidase [Veronia nyctiphanis]RXJ73312.1 hypothetical protein CS022_09980 [Veronia nyctiphanis]
MRAFITVISATLLLISSTVNAATKLEVTPAKSAEEKAVLKFTKPIADEFIALINKEFPLYKPMIVRLGGGEGPHFDPEKMEIAVPFTFVTQVLQRFRSPDAEIEGYMTAKEATRHAVMHVLLHELGHALVYDHDIPILGKEEDAVDNFATLVMLWHQGAEETLASAELFALFDLEVEEFSEAHFWGEHSLDAQRATSVVCLVYGSDPDKYEYLMGEQQKENDREGHCQYEYESKSRNWERATETARKLRKP